MKLAITALGIVIGAAAALPVAAQDLGIKEPSIIVVGVGKVEVAPDRFTVRATATGQGADQVSALQALAATQSRVTDGLQRLDGLTHRAVSHSSVSVTPTFAGDCEEARYGGRGAACPITGYTATTEMMFEGAPVDQAGNAVSLASQLGARDASLVNLSLADDTAPRAEASRAAFADARRQADLLAAASGQRIVRVLRMQQADERAYMYAEAADAAAPAAADAAVDMELMSPNVPLSLEAAPQVITSRLAVAFEIQ